MIVFTTRCGVAYYGILLSLLLSSRSTATGGYQRVRFCWRLRNFIGAFHLQAACILEWNFSTIQFFFTIVEPEEEFGLTRNLLNKWWWASTNDGVFLLLNTYFSSVILVLHRLVCNRVTIEEPGRTRLCLLCQLRRRGRWKARYFYASSWNSEGCRTTTAKHVYGRWRSPRQGLSLY